MNNYNIGDTLNIAEWKPNNKEIPLSGTIEEGSVDAAINDFERARSNIVNIIEIGTVAIKEAGILASAGQTAAGYESLAKMMKEASDLSEKLMKIHTMTEKLVANKKALTMETSDKKTFNMSTHDISLALKKLEGPVIDG